MPCLEPVAQRGRRDRLPPPASARASARRDAQAGDRRHVLGAARGGCARACRRSWSACSRVPRLIHSAPAPFGPLNLCADSDSRSTPSARTSTGILPTDCTASVCNSAPCSCAIAARSRDRLNRADLVVGVHHRDERGVVGDRLAQRPRRRRCPVLIDGQQRRAPAAPRERLERVEHRLVLDARWRSGGGGRSASSASAAPRIAKLSDSVPPLVNTISGGIGADQRARSPIAHRRAAPWPADRSDARSTRCRSRRAARAATASIDRRVRAGSSRCSRSRRGHAAESFIVPSAAKSQQQKD